MPQPAPSKAPRCPLCRKPTAPLGAVDFNRSCAEAQGLRLPPANRPVAYVQCRTCGFAFAPMFQDWTAADFAREIYNAGYGAVDPDHKEVRPRANAQTILGMFPGAARPARHLDYGGGAGRMSELLRAAGWDSACYDPFFDGDKSAEPAGTYSLITCFEVFEHVTDPRALAATLDRLLAPDGLMLVSTLVSDGNLAPGRPLTWWYAAPRNGHVSLYARTSLDRLATRQGWRFASFSPESHVFWRGEFPAFARHLLAR
ncbi:MAG: class I SAM-dependent methyltransferase [Gammaproteobacteria bacterium]|nr:class I SAM-dependent methyltransferase [Gammaproteobacteria bacterium]